MPHKTSTGVDHGRLAYHEARLVLLRGSILEWTTPLLHTCVWLLKRSDPQQAVLPKLLFLWTKPPQQMCDMGEYLIWPQDLDINASSRLSWSWVKLRVPFSPNGPENRISLIKFIEIGHVAKTLSVGASVQLHEFSISMICFRKLVSFSARL